MHVPSQRREKLEDNNMKCIFIGYSTETKGNHFYNPFSKKLIVSRDVVFDKAVLGIGRICRLII